MTIKTVGDGYDEMTAILKGLSWMSGDRPKNQVLAEHEGKRRWLEMGDRLDRRKALGLKQNSRDSHPLGSRPCISRIGAKRVGQLDISALVLFFFCLWPKLQLSSPCRAARVEGYGFLALFAAMHGRALGKAR
jgi:hypothetical protein